MWRGRRVPAPTPSTSTGADHDPDQHRSPSGDDHFGGSLIHPRQVHSSFYDAERLGLSRMGVDYLLPIFSTAIGAEDMAEVQQSLFSSGNLTQPYHSVNVDINKRICYLE
jgi:hypothetical protein